MFGQRRRRAGFVAQLNTIEMEQIVTLLLDNVPFVRDVTSPQGRFIAELGLSPAEFLPGVNDCIRGIKKPNELIRDILRGWIRRCRQENSNADIERLYNASLSMHNVGLADDLREYGLEKKVVEPYYHINRTLECCKTHKSVVSVAILGLVVIVCMLYFFGQDSVLQQVTNKTHNSNVQYNTNELTLPKTLPVEIKSTSSTTSPEPLFNSVTTPKICTGKAKTFTMKSSVKKVTKRFLRESCVDEWEELFFYMSYPGLLRFMLQYTTSLNTLFVGSEICESPGILSDALQLGKSPVVSNIDKLILDPMMPAECSGKVLRFIANNFVLEQLEYVTFPPEFLINELNIEGLNYFLVKFGSNLRELNIIGGFHVFNESSVPFKNVNLISLESLIFNNTAADSVFIVDTAENLIKGIARSPLQRIRINIPLHYRSSYFISHYYKTLSEVELIINLDESSIFDFLELFRDCSKLKRVYLKLIDQYDGSCSGKTISLLNFDKKTIPNDCQTITVRSLCPLNLISKKVDFHFTRNGDYYEYSFVNSV